MNLYSFYFTHRETDAFFEGSGVQDVQSNRGQFHFETDLIYKSSLYLSLSRFIINISVVFFSHLKVKADLVLPKVPTLRITLNIDDTPIVIDHTLTHHTRERYS